MGKPFEMVIDGRLVRLCCAKCEAKVRADPLATLNAADVGLFWTWSPAAHTATFVEDGVTPAGEPQWAVGLAVGLHLGAL